MFENMSNIYDLHLSSGIVLTLTWSHPVLTQSGWKAIDVESAKKEHWIEVEELHEGDEILSADGAVIVESIVKREDLNGSTVYNIDTEPHDTYLANGIIVHNAESKD